ncbi:MAG: tetratricopeptide repeat protein [Alphaproteobacteria bacterium]|nr:MAG: tetratricopeptide repeat protein [Alphaproteobacteria bacterium]
MIRLILFVAQLLALAVAGAWLAGEPGSVTIDWHGWRVQSSAAALVVVVLVLCLMAMAVYHAWDWIRYGSRRLLLQRRLNHALEGQVRVTETLAALASGDHARAAKLARSAAGILGRASPLAIWLEAQASRLARDVPGTRRLLMKLLEKPGPGSVLGYRGLLTLAQDAGNSSEMASLAQGWSREDKHSPTARLTVLESELASRRWASALLALREVRRLRALPEERIKRYEAVISLAGAREARARGEVEEAQRLVIPALRLQPHWEPAVLFWAGLLIEVGKRRLAGRTLLAAWKRRPSAALAQAWMEALDPAKSGIEGRVRQARALHEVDPAQAEGRLILAEALRHAGRLDEARDVLQPLAHDPPDRRYWQMLAAIETDKGEQGASVSHLLRMALAAPEPPSWRCGQCGAARPVDLEWIAHCPSCGAFDSLMWSEDAAASGSTSTAPFSLMGREVEG